MHDITNSELCCRKCSDRHHFLFTFGAALTYVHWTPGAQFLHSLYSSFLLLDLFLIVFPMFWNFY